MSTSARRLSCAVTTIPPRTATVMSVARLLETCEAVGLVLLAQLIDELVDVAVHAPRDVREVVPDALVGDAVLRVVVCARLLGPLAMTDLRAPRVALLGIAALLLEREKARTQDLHRFGTVLQLRALVLDRDHQ